MLVISLVVTVQRVGGKGRWILAFAKGEEGVERS